MAGKSDRTVRAAEKVEKAEKGYPCVTCGVKVKDKDLSLQCEICEGWCHAQCEKISEEVLIVLERENFHWYCLKCNSGIGKLFNVVMKLQERMDVVDDYVRKTDGKMVKLREEIMSEMNKAFEKVDRRMNETLKVHDITQVIADELKKYDKEDKRDGEEFKKLEKEVNDIKTVMDDQVTRTVMVVKEDVEEALEIERRKMNLIFHGVPETDAEQDIEQVAEILSTGLHMDFDRHVSTVYRIGRMEENKPRPLRILVKSLDGKKEILSRAKDLKKC